MVRPLLDEYFTFDAGADEGARIKTRVEDGAGEVVAFDALLRHVQTIPDLAAMLRPPSGGGASGGRAIEMQDKAKPREKVASPFGLR